jgi:hypothetical protein
MQKGFGKQEGAGRIATHGIVVGSPVSGCPPGRLPWIAERKAEAGEKTQREKLPVIAVEGVGALVVEGDGESFGAEAAVGEQLGGDHDDRSKKAEQRDGICGAGDGEDGRVAGAKEELTGAAACARETDRAEGDAEAAEERESDPEGGGGCEEEAESADAFGSRIGFEADVGRNTGGRGDEQRGNGGGKLDAVENAFAAAGGSRLEAAQDEGRAAGEDQLNGGLQQTADDEQQAEEAKGPGEDHGWRSFFERGGSAWARAERMLDSSWSRRSVS